MKWPIIFTICICMIACEKKSEFDNYKIKATMSNKSLKTFPAIFFDNETKFSKTEGLQGEQIIISGIKKGGEYSLTLGILNPKVGTFNLLNSMQGSCSAIIPYETFNSNYYYTTSQMGSGSITVVSLTDSSIEGSFNAICIGLTDTLIITNGRFSSTFN